MVLLNLGKRENQKLNSQVWTMQVIQVGPHNAMKDFGPYTFTRFDTDHLTTTEILIPIKYLWMELGFKKGGRCYWNR